MESLNPNAGGSYLRQPDGTLTQVEAPTIDHPDGNAPREAPEASVAEPKSAARKKGAE